MSRDSSRFTKAAVNEQKAQERQIIQVTQVPCIPCGAHAASHGLQSELAFSNIHQAGLVHQCTTGAGAAGQRSWMLLCYVIYNHLQSVYDMFRYVSICFDMCWILLDVARGCHKFNGFELSDL